jgi:DNA-directed RNA polymerase III subunit RPC5
MSQQDRTLTSQAAGKDGANGAAGGAGTSGPSGPAAAPRAIHMTIKTTGDSDAVTTETMADRLRSVQTEPWRKLKYTDENEEASWDVFHESLVLRPRDGTGAGETSDGKKVVGDGEGDGHLKTVADQTVLARAVWEGHDLLQAVSGIQKPNPNVKIEILDDAAEAPAPPKLVTESSKKAAPKPRAPAGARRGARGKTALGRAGASSVSAMDIDG